MYASFRKARRALKNELRRNYARFKRSRSKATFVAVTGSSAKTTTVALLSHILSGTAKVKTQAGDNGLLSTLQTLGNVRREHDYVVCEIGAAGPGTLKPIFDLIKPSVGIVTLVGLEHYTAFRSKEAVAKEKGALVEVLPQSGLAILNKDDARVLAMQDLTKARVVTFGQSEADYSNDELISTALGGLAFMLTHRDRQIRLETRLTGAHNRLAVSAAAACALELGVSEDTVIERVASFEPVFGRLSIHAIDGGPTFILDTAKAPYHSITLSIEVLRDCIAPRKRFVLGQLADFAGNPNPKYRDTYRAARDVADQVIFVGGNSHRSKATREEIEAGKFIAFSTAEELSKYIKSTAIAGEVILLKSSKNLHLERVALDWTTDVKCWSDACGVAWGCLDCGLYNTSFAEHRGKAAKLKSGRRQWFTSRRSASRPE
jgi:UDP-N-acetylmuramoyl-tripeptide--D-alanyl-D-alanine ligase